MSVRSSVSHEHVRGDWRGKKFLSRAEIRRRLPQIKSESRRFGRAEHRLAASLDNPPAPWPSLVRKTVKIMAGKTAKGATILFNMGRANSAAGWIVRTRHFLDVYESASGTSERIRTKLDLPPAGKGCD